MRNKKELMLRKRDEVQADEYAPDARNFYPASDIYKTGEGYEADLEIFPQNGIHRANTRFFPNSLVKLYN